MRPLAEGNHLGVAAAYQTESNLYVIKCRHTTPTSVVVPPIFRGVCYHGEEKEHGELTSTTTMLVQLPLTLEPLTTIPER